MQRNQISKILKVALVATIIMLVFEIIFSIGPINDWFAQLVVNSGKWAYVVIWVIMFLQVTILNIPAYVILSASATIGIETLSFKYIIVVLSAYMLGAMLTYFLGRKFGKGAVRWCAGNDEDYDKWSGFINNKGKWFYFCTVLLPFFPDDLLCLVCGATKMNFTFFSITNLIGRGVGLVAMLMTIKLIGFINGNFPVMIIVWVVALLAEIIALIVLNKKEKTNGTK